VREEDLYGPVKAHLQGVGYEVRAEVQGCDVVGVRDGQVVAVEMKIAFGVPVLQQALDRLPACDLVYVAVAAPEGRRARGNWDRAAPKTARLCRMLGLGLLEVRDGRVSVLADPTHYQPRRSPLRRAKLLSEFSRRSGDHNVGGTTRRPRVTAYREDALRVARALAEVGGAAKPSAVRDAAGVPKAAAILRSDVYGWFERVAPGLYAITPAGRGGLDLYADVVAAQAPAPPGPGPR